QSDAELGVLYLGHRLQPRSIRSQRHDGAKGCRGRPMKQGHVVRVKVALVALDVIALTDDPGDLAVLVGGAQEVESRQLRQLGRETDWLPVASQEVAAWRPGSRASDELILFL